MCLDDVCNYHCSKIERKMLPRGYHIRVQFLSTIFGEILLENNCLIKNLFVFYFVIFLILKSNIKISSKFVKHSIWIVIRMVDYLWKTFWYSSKSATSSTAYFDWNKMDQFITLLWRIGWDCFSNDDGWCVWKEIYSGRPNYSSRGRYFFSKLLFFSLHLFSKWLLSLHG